MPVVMIIGNHDMCPERVYGNGTTAIDILEYTCMNIQKVAKKVTRKRVQCSQTHREENVTIVMSPVSDFIPTYLGMHAPHTLEIHTEMTSHEKTGGPVATTSTLIDISSVSMQNFLCFETNEISFASYNRNIIGVFDDNGSGKSCFIDAILFCLYGKSSRGNKADDHVLIDETGKKATRMETKVSIVCVDSGSTFQIHREYHTNERLYTLSFHDGTTLIHSKAGNKSSSVNGRIVAIFGEYDTFVSRFVQKAVH